MTTKLLTTVGGAAFAVRDQAGYSVGRNPPTRITKEYTTPITLASFSTGTWYYSSVLGTEQAAAETAASTTRIQLVSFVGYSTSTGQALVSVIEWDGDTGTNPPASYTTLVRFPVAAGGTFSCEVPVFSSGSNTLGTLVSAPDGGIYFTAITQAYIPMPS